MSYGTGAGGHPCPLLFDLVVNRCVYKETGGFLIQKRSQLPLLVFQSSVKLFGPGVRNTSYIRKEHGL
jgi:hypothetical protein